MPHILAEYVLALRCIRAYKGSKQEYPLQMLRCGTSGDAWNAVSALCHEFGWVGKNMFGGLQWEI